MERTKFKRPDAILCSDFHLREDTPVCWINSEEFQEEQWNSVGFVCGLQRKYNCLVIHAGDLFNHWKPSPWLISMALQYLPDQFWTVYGQHDLPQHSLELTPKSGLYTLVQAKKINLLWQCHYGQLPVKMEESPAQLGFSDPTKEMLVWHNMTYTVKPFPGASGGFAAGKLMKHPDYDIIVTGDNHQSFSTTYEGRLLVNPGSLTRQDADQIDFQPRVALWYADTNTVEWVNIPIKQGVISREHIEHKEDRDKRIDAFVSRLDGDWEVGLSFEQNLETFFNVNETREPIKSIIYKAIEK
jgi:predicted phosphodiesterase